MIALDAKHLLFIHPTTPPSAEPVIDELTRKMAGALRGARVADESKWLRGRHGCTGGSGREKCRSASGYAPLYVATTSGELHTNSLAVHYLARHRADVPQSELAKVRLLTAEPVEPTAADLQDHVLSPPIPFPE